MGGGADWQAWAAKLSGKRVRQPVYCDPAIQTCLTMKVLFGMALRQTTGFVESLLRRIGLNWELPDFSTHSRRPKTLAVNNPDPASKGPLHHMTTTSDMGDVEPVNASGSSEPARHAARTIGPDPC